MLSINTNLSSIIVQHSMNTATAKLNQAIERMTTGAKINHAKDNAAGYSIATNLTTKMNAYMVAQDNVTMGLDMVATMSENLDLVNEHLKRIRDLCEQASNGTYGEESLKAIQSEIDARVAEVERLKSSAEFNGIKLLESEQATPATFGARQASGGVTRAFIEEVDQLTEDEAIAQGYTIIKTADELQAMQNNLSGKYILMNDIDLAGYDWSPVGTDWSEFTGELNGNGFVIKNLTINQPTEYSVGLFGDTNGATIKNLGIENADVTGQDDVGILIGSGFSINIENIYVKGSVHAENSAVGGIIGATHSTIIANSYSNSSVSGNSCVGGILGSEGGTSGATLTNCYSSGSVSGNDMVGGLAGSNNSPISNCYSDCVVSGTTNVGGLVGFTYGLDIENSYWDTEKSGTTVGVASGSPTGTFIGVTTAELQALINNGTLPKIYTPTVAPTGSPTSITLQVGTSGDSNSQITFDLATTLAPLEITITDSDSARSYLTELDSYLAKISDYQTNLGAVINRLESALDEITIQYENLASSRSTIRDADIAKVSSEYIKMQILQQASSTLLATANQTPSIALQLI